MFQLVVCATKTHVQLVVRCRNIVHNANVCRLVQWLLSALNAQGVWLVDVSTDARLAPIHLAIVNDNEQMLDTLVEMVCAHTMRCVFALAGTCEHQSANSQHW